MKVNKIYLGDCRQILRSFPDESIDLVMYSPPYYGLRDYGKGTEIEWADGWCGQLGLEPNWKMYIDHMIEINREIKRVLKRAGSLYVNMGDTYAGSHCGQGDKTLFQNPKRAKVAECMYRKESPQKEAIGYQPKCLMGIPWRFAFAMIEDGWILRNAIIWYKPNHMPESVKDRLTKTYEYIFHFVKSRKYYYNLDMIRESYSANAIKRATREYINQLVPQIKDSKWIKGHEAGIVRDPLPNLHGKSYAETYFGKYLEIEEEKLQKYYGSPRARVKRFLKGLSLIYEEMEKVQAKYDSKYSVSEYGQKLQGFTRGDAIAKMRETSRIMAKKLFPNNPRLQQEFINWVHDHAGDLRGKNPGDLWSINLRPLKETHYAAYPIDICLRPILSSCPPDGIVLDPMCGSGTTLLACNLINFKMWDEFRIPVNDYARKTDWNLRWIGIEINPEYVEIAMKRLEPFIHQKKLVDFIDKTS